MNVEAKGLDYKALNEAIRAAGPSCRITGCLGQRFIGAGMSGRQVEIDGIPGNALGAYLGGGTITVNGNAQDAVGDTMNDGSSSSTAAWGIRRATPCGAARSMCRAMLATGWAST